MPTWNESFKVALRVTFLTVGLMALFIVVVFLGLAFLGSTSQGIYAGMAVAIIAGILIMVAVQAVTIKFTVEQALKEFGQPAGVTQSVAVPSGQPESKHVTDQCKSCHAPLPTGADYCVYCGASQH